jgi:hypothetical protein
VLPSWSRIRRLVTLLFLLGATGTAADLLFIGHYEDSWQVAPLALLGFGTGAALWALLAREGGGRRALQAAAWLLVLGGAVGLQLHYAANMEIEREVSPTLSGAALWWKAARGAAPPSLAPGTLIHLGLLGLICTIKGETT